jgi:hypothetical protein
MIMCSWLLSIARCRVGWHTVSVPGYLSFFRAMITGRLKKSAESRGTVLLDRTFHEFSLKLPPGKTPYSRCAG